MPAVSDPGLECASPTRKECPDAASDPDSRLRSRAAPLSGGGRSVPCRLTLSLASLSLLGPLLLPIAASIKLEEVRFCSGSGGRGTGEGSSASTSSARCVWAPRASLIVVGVLRWLVNTYIPMDSKARERLEHRRRSVNGSKRGLG